MGQILPRYLSGTGVYPRTERENDDLCIGGKIGKYIAVMPQQGMKVRERERNAF